MLIIIVSITIITCFMYIGIIIASCIWGCSITMMTHVKVSLIDISEQLLICNNICTKIHTRGVDYNMIWNIYIKVQNHNEVKSKGLGSGEWCTEILYNKKPIGAW
jgi:hypothetical protein